MNQAEYKLELQHMWETDPESLDSFERRLIGVGEYAGEPPHKAFDGPLEFVGALALALGTVVMIALAYAVVSSVARIAVDLFR